MARAAPSSAARLELQAVTDLTSSVVTPSPSGHRHAAARVPHCCCVAARVPSRWRDTPPARAISRALPAMRRSISPGGCRRTRCACGNRSAGRHPAGRRGRALRPGNWRRSSGHRSERSDLRALGDGVRRRRGTRLHARPPGRRGVADPDRALTYSVRARQEDYPVSRRQRQADAKIAPMQAEGTAPSASVSPPVVARPLAARRHGQHSTVPDSLAPGSATDRPVTRRTSAGSRCPESSTRICPTPSSASSDPGRSAPRRARTISGLARSHVHARRPAAARMISRRSVPLYLELLRRRLHQVAEFLYLHRLGRELRRMRTWPSQRRPAHRHRLTAAATLYQHADFWRRSAAPVNCLLCAARRCFSRTGRHCAGATRE